MADLASVAPMLKEVWPDSFETAFSQEIVGIARVERTSDGISQDYSGRYVVIPMKVRRNQGIGSRAERAVLPLPGQQGWVGTRVTMRYQYGIGDITAQGLKLADREPRSFVNLIDEEMSGLRDDVMKDYARQFYGDGTGTLATISAVGAVGAGPNGGTVLTVDSTQYTQVEMLLDSVAPAGPTVHDAELEVLAVDEDAKTVEVSGATAATVANDVIVRSGDYDQEINGTGVLIDDTLEVQNLAPADEPQWASQVHSSGVNRAWDEMQFITAMDAGRRRSGKFASVIFTDFGGRRAMFANLSQGREYVNTIEFAHGFSALPFNYGARQVPVVEDPDYPTDFDAEETSFMGLSEDQIKVYREPEGWHFAEETGSMFIAKADRSDAWEFRLRQFSQLGISQRNCHWRVTDITNIPE